MGLRTAGLLLLFALFFALRIYRLGANDFWYDEVHSLSYAAYPWANWNAPLYWIVLHFWTAVFGISEFSLRLPSAVFGLLAVIAVFLFGSAVFDRKTGTFAALIAGLSPFYVWYAQEARDYAMLLCLATFSSLLLVLAVRSGRKLYWSAYAAVALAALYTSYFFLLLFAAQAVYLLIAGRYAPNRSRVITFAAVVLGFVLYLPRFWAKFTFVQGGFWLLNPTAGSVLITVENFFLGYNGTFFLYTLCDLLLCACGFSVVRACLREPSVRGQCVGCLVLAAVPLLLAFLFSKLFFSVYLDRGLIIASPYLFCLAAFGLSRLGRSAGLTVAAGLASAAIIALVFYYQGKVYHPLQHHMGAYSKKPVKPLAAFLETRVRGDEMILSSNVSFLPSLEFYLKGAHPVYFVFDPAFPDTNWNRPYAETEKNMPVARIGGLGFRRVWLLASDWPRSGELDENSLAVKQELERSFRLISTCEFDGIMVMNYER